MLPLSIIVSSPVTQPCDIITVSGSYMSNTPELSRIVWDTQRIDSVGHGRTRSVSLFVGSTERKSDRERLRKVH